MTKIDTTTTRSTTELRHACTNYIYTKEQRSWLAQGASMKKPHAQCASLNIQLSNIQHQLKMSNPYILGCSTYLALPLLSSTSIIIILLLSFYAIAT